MSHRAPGPVALTSTEIGPDLTLKRDAWGGRGPGSSLVGIGSAGIDGESRREEREQRTDETLPESFVCQGGDV